MAWSIIISISILIIVGLIIQYTTSILYAQIETLLLGPVLIIVGYAFYKKTRDKLIKDIILKVTVIIGVIILALSVIFAAICNDGFFAKMLVLFYIGTGVTIAESSSKSSKKTYTGVGAGYVAFSGGDAGGGSGGCGGGGCCG